MLDELRLERVVLALPVVSLAPQDSLWIVLRERQQGMRQVPRKSRPRRGDAMRIAVSDTVGKARCCQVSTVLQNGVGIHVEERTGARAIVRQPRSVVTHVSHIHADVAPPLVLVRHVPVLPNRHLVIVGGNGHRTASVCDARNQVRWEGDSSSGESITPVVSRKLIVACVSYSGVCLITIH